MMKEFGNQQWLLLIKKIGKFGRLIGGKKRRREVTWIGDCRENRASWLFALMEVDDLGDECDSFDSGN